LDPIAHTFTGAALAASGLRRTTPLATATLLIGANAPDIDVVSAFGAPFESFAFRRGWTHGVLALAILPLVITALMLLWDRWVRRRENPSAATARAGPILGLAALAVLTHPALDWLNNYGLRWLMPFDGRWFYGDAVFIIDPWIWLGFGGIAFLTYSYRLRSLIGGSVFWLLASTLILTTPDVPLAARVLWLNGVAAVLVIRGLRLTSDARVAEHGARIVIACIVTYVGAMVAADFAERSLVRAELAARGIADVEQVMVAPTPANPFAGEVVAATAASYYVGRWRWWPEPALELTGEPIAKRTLDPIYRAAAQTPEVQRFLTWARFPFIEVESDPSGHVVRFIDARYVTTERLPRPIVQLDRELRPVRRTPEAATQPPR
jgi:inner membrane protein